jgi:thioredoxin 1
MMDETYTPESVTREEVDAMHGPLVLDFGTNWCGWCRGAQPHIRSALATHPGTKHIKIEDGPGRRLGRSFGVKLWPTLVFMKDGREIARVTRPSGAAEIESALARIT